MARALGCAGGSAYRFDEPDGHDRAAQTQAEAVSRWSDQEVRRVGAVVLGDGRLSSEGLLSCGMLKSGSDLRWPILKLFRRVGLRRLVVVVSGGSAGLRAASGGSGV